MGLSFFGKGGNGRSNVATEGNGFEGGAFADGRREYEKEPKTSFDRVIQTLIFSFLGILFFGITLFFTGLTLQGAVFDRYIFFLLLALFSFVAWIMGGVYAGKLEVRRTPLDIPLLLFWGMYGISMIFSNDVWHSFTGAFLDPSRGFIVVTATILLYYVVVSTQALQSLYRLAGLFVTGLGIFAIWGALAISGIFRGGSGILSFFTSVPIDDFFALNILLTITLPLVIAFLLHIVSQKTPSGVKTTQMILGLIVIFCYIYILGSLYLAVTLLALFIGMGIFISYISGDIIRVSKQWLWLPLIIFLGVLPILYFLGQSIVAKDGLQLPQSVFPGVQISWETLSNTVAQRFFSGTGPATYAYAFSHFFPESLNATSEFTRRLTYPANYLFEMVVTTGVLGGLFFVGLLAFAFSVAGYLLTQRRETNSVLSLGFWVSLLVSVIVGFFYGFSGSVVFPSLLLAILGMAIVLRESDARPRSIVFSLRSAPQYALASTLLLLVACIGALALFATLGKMYAADIYAGRALQEQSGDKKKAIENIENAIRLNGREGQYFVLRGQMYFALANDELEKLNQSGDDKSKESTQQAQLLIGESIRSLVRGRDLLPGNIFAQEALAQVFESLGFFEDAYNAYKDAIKIEPKNPIYPVKMAQMRIVQAEGKDDKETYYSEAERLIGDSLALKKDFGEAWYQKALLFEGRKDLDQSVESAKMALKVNRDVRSGLLVARLYQLRGKDGDSKNAEDILNAILGINDKEVNAQLSLAGLYERTGRTKEAIDRYAKVRDLLPDQSAKAKEQLNTIINDLKNGKSTSQIELQNQDQSQSQS